ncbi:MAG: DUF47 family protein [bacterium]|nr:DUF47 family protein [bacterium]
MKTIGGDFGPNVFEPLYEHLCKARLCTELITECVDALMSRDRARMEELAQRISEAELQADHIKLAIRHGLTKSIFAAVRRTDVLQIVRYQDRIADRAEDIAKLLALRDTRVPPAAHESLRSLMHSVLQTVTTLCVAVQRFVSSDERPSSAAARADAMPDVLEHIHQLENQSDHCIEQFLRTLFQHESSSDPISVMLLFQTARLMGQMADAAENAAEFYAAVSTE